MAQINVVGCGPGSKDYLLPLAREMIENAEILIASSKTFLLADKINTSPIEKILIDKHLNKVIDYLEKNVINQDKEATLLVTGDPGFYSLLGLLKNKFPRENFNIIPGISSLQVAFARLADMWHDATIISLHGREENFSRLYSHLHNKDKIAVLLGNTDTHELKDKLLANNIPQSEKVTICENLSLPDEEVYETTLEGLDNYPPKKDCLLIFRPGQKGNQELIYTSFMIRDDEFIRENVPMTKEEIRTIILARLKLFQGAVLWDIGAGTGSISIQGAMHVGADGLVYAIDHKEEAIKLIEKNKQKFSCPQVETIKGKAPEALKTLAPPNRVIIGGSDRRIKKILAYLDELNMFEGPIVIPTIALETFEEAYDYFRNNKQWKVDVSKIQINSLEEQGNLSLWKSKNPVSIIVAQK